MSQWMPSAVDYPRDAAVHELVEAQARLTPDSIAIISDHYAITYSELNARANQLARHLRHVGVAPGSPVAICMDRSPELVASMLAILKAGGAYVPLDASYPPHRLSYMLEVSGARVVLATHETATKVPTSDAATILVDRDWATIDSYEKTDLGRTASATDPCYIIFTSGSTGTPKGVVMPHRPLVNLVWWHLISPDAPGATGGHERTAAAKTMQFAPVSFDVSFQEIFSTWASGGTLVLVTEELRLDPDALLDYICGHAVERLYLPVVMLLQLAEALVPGAPLPVALQDVITAGEALQVTPAVARFFEALPDCKLHNHYGPSETHVVTAYMLSGPPASWPTFPPIGKAISNTATLVLGDNLQAVDDGDEGELYLAGDCLADGYVGRDDLTAERFVDVAVGDGVITRAYKTGDRVRSLGDGVLDYLGRVDQQIKIRGYRVESGEIEQVLIKHPTVSQAAVVAKVYDDGDKALVAYIVGQPGSEPPGPEIRAHLRGSLPDYMIPATFVVVDTLPLTPSGKVDRKALAERELTSGERSTMSDSSAASLRLDEYLSALWREGLHVDQVGVDENFFEIGGTSVQAVKMYRKLKAHLKQEFPVTTLFQYPTIKTLAAHLGASDTPNGATPAGNGAHRDPMAHLQALRGLRRG